MRLIYLGVVFAGFHVLAAVAQSNVDSIYVVVKDTDPKPVEKLRIRILGGAWGTTDSTGTTLLTFDPNTLPKPPELQIDRPLSERYKLLTPSGNELALFLQTGQRKIEVNVLARGEPKALKSARFTVPAAEQILRETIKQGEHSGIVSKSEALDVLAKEYGFTAAQIDEAIRAQVKQTNDPYAKGLYALYEGDLPKATEFLTASAEAREKRYAAAREVLEASAHDFATANFYLGSALFREKRYKESAATNERVLGLDPDNPTVLNNAAMSASKSGDRKTARDRYLKAIAIDQGNPHANPVRLAASLGNYAGFLLEEVGIFLNAGDEAGATRTVDDATRLLNEAVDLLKDAHEERDRRMAWTLDYLGQIAAPHDPVKARGLYDQALDIYQHGTSPSRAGEASVLIDLGDLLNRERRYPEALDTIVRAMEIHASLPEIGKDDPLYADDLWVEGVALYRSGKPDEAIKALERAYDIYSKARVDDRATKKIAETLASMRADRRQM